MPIHDIIQITIPPFHSPTTRKVLDMTILEKIEAWTSILKHTPVTRSSGWHVARDATPERNQPVLGFYSAERTARLLLHREASVYELLLPGQAWFDDNSEPLDKLFSTPDQWMTIPKHLYMDEERTP